MCPLRGIGNASLKQEADVEDAVMRVTFSHTSLGAMNKAVSVTSEFNYPFVPGGKCQDSLVHVTRGQTPRASLRARHAEVHMPPPDVRTCPTDVCTRSTDVITRPMNLSTPSTEVCTRSTDVSTRPTDVCTPSTDVCRPSTDANTRPTDVCTPSTEGPPAPLPNHGNHG